MNALTHVAHHSHLRASPASMRPDSSPPAAHAPVQCLDERTPAAPAAREPRRAAPLWQGAWVGWLTAQVVVLVSLEGVIPSASLNLVSALRLALVGGVSALFARPCFEVQRERTAFIGAVIAAEVVIAAYCDRLTPAFYGLLLGTAAIIHVLVERPSARTTARLVAEARYAALARLTRLASALPQRSSFWTRHRDRLSSKLMRAVWAATFEYLESERRRCASAVNRHRQLSLV